MSKLKGITMQQQPKIVENGGPQHLHGSTMRKGAQVSSDEFKYGFPSDGLAVVFYKWWGSSSLENEDTSGDGGEDIEEDKGKAEESIDDGTNELLSSADKPESGSDESNINPKGAVLLSRMRKRSAEAGQEALRLHVYRDYGINKLNRRESKLLFKIFQSSLASHWRYGTFES